MNQLALRGCQGILRAQQQVAEQLHKACLECGFFYVQNHGLSEAQCKGVLQDCRSWFSLEVGPVLHMCRGDSRAMHASAAVACCHTASSTACGMYVAITCFTMTP